MKRFILLVAILALGGCDEDHRHPIEKCPDKFLPSNATNIVQQGNDWITFDWNDGKKTRHFIYRRSGYANAVTEAITELSE